ncbi:2-succinyl-5-enolpyruvyl-6-hydroxy-3-cyclohexene- 1-carboxylate synthase [Gemmatimonadetes bacterium T265]|nr:2-succinyl-5-enolpyruvyl-6-hydroxy-3-cyclohexene- 1-carboxylate synthase [Gemmatimonadetes bacterium T265]
MTEPTAVPAPRPDQAATAFVGAFVDELARAGVRHVCVAPGSRSTPLALMVAEHLALETWVHLDERSAAFFALGMARASGAPVALLCTSGSAAANFFPAVVEARAARIPLLVFTADRPPELHDVGAAQTIDQHRLYGPHAKWSVDVALPEASPALVRYARALAGRAAALAAATPAGPVHLNFPFREPLVPAPVARPDALSAADALAWDGRAGGAPWVAVADAPPAPDAATARRLTALLAGARRPLVVCGPQPDRALAAPLAALARAAGAPMLADPLSQARWGAHRAAAGDETGDATSDCVTVVDRYDAALRDEATAVALAPDVVLRVGALPTSKPLLQYLERHGAARQVVVDAAGWPDPSLMAAEVVHADPRRLAEAVVAAWPHGRAPADAGWLTRWRRVDAAAGAALARYVDACTEPFDGRALAAAAALVPAGGTLFVSSSMPVRDLDAFAPGDARALRVMANRGANGIDGVVSTALGAAAAARAGGDGGPLVLVIGDLAFYHDMNGLLAAKLHALDATVVLLNNDGGGIFSFLPQAAHPAHFERLFGTPHGLDFAPAAALYGARYTRADTWDAFRAGVAAGVGGRGLHVIELRTDRARNVGLHRAAWAAVAAAVGDALGDRPTDAPPTAAGRAEG